MIEKSERDLALVDRTGSGSKGGTLAARQPSQVEVDETKAVTGYANFCRLSGTPEEVLLDFALSPQPMVTPMASIVVTHRIVTGWHTAKRLLQILRFAVERHEAAFGVLEIDVQKRAGRS